MVVAICRPLDQFTGDGKLLKKDCLLIIHGLNDPGYIFGAVSRDIVEFDCKAVFLQSVPCAVPAEESKIQAKVDEYGLDQINIPFFCENAIHGLALCCVGLMECGLP